MKAEYKCNVMLVMPPSDLPLSDKLDWFHERFGASLSAELMAYMALLLINEMPIQDKHYRFTIIAESFPDIKSLIEQEMKDAIIDEFVK